MSYFVIPLEIDHQGLVSSALMTETVSALSHYAPCHQSITKEQSSFNGFSLEKLSIYLIFSSYYLLHQDNKKQWERYLGYVLSAPLPMSFVTEIVTSRLHYSYRQLYWFFLLCDHGIVTTSRHCDRIK